MSLPRPLIALAVAGLFLFAPSALAVDAPRQMTFQGRMLRVDGSPETLPQDLRFALYATPSGGAPLWEESHLGTTITNGYYAVVLGTSTPTRIVPPGFGAACACVAVPPAAEVAPASALPVVAPCHYRAPRCGRPGSYSPSVPEPRLLTSFR